MRAKALKIGYSIYLVRALALMGRTSKKKKISRLELDQKHFNYDYFTGLHVNTRGKTIHRVYDFSWAIFTDQEVLIMRNEAL